MGTGLAITRRELLKRLGLGGAALVAASFIPKLAGAETSSQTVAVTGTRLRRWSMVIDLRRCDGCIGLGLPPQCTQACILGRMVPVGMEWIQVFEDDLPRGGTYFLPAPCMHCQNTPCLNV